MYCLYFPSNCHNHLKFTGGKISPFGSLTIAKLIGWDHASVFHGDKSIRSRIQAYKGDREKVREVCLRLADLGFTLPHEKFLKDVDNWVKPEKFK
jgi:hypothetical protein